MKAIVVHSGGMDSSICLKLAIEEFGKDHVTALSFDYRQRNRAELEAGARICQEWNVQRKVIDFPVFSQLTTSALLDPAIKLEHCGKGPSSAWVVGRNGTLLHLAGIYAHHVGADTLWTGVMQRPGSNSGYPDCSREYMDMMQQLLRVDLNSSRLEIRTPLVAMTKAESLAVAHKLGVLDFLLAQTVTCYEGILATGCGLCASCVLRRLGLEEFQKKAHLEVVKNTSFR